MAAAGLYRDKEWIHDLCSYDLQVADLELNLHNLNNACLCLIRISGHTGAEADTPIDAR